jgi:hypothetical protein
LGAKEKSFESKKNYGSKTVNLGTKTNLGEKKLSNVFWGSIKETVGQK